MHNILKSKINLRSMKGSGTRIGYAKGGSISNSNNIIVLKWLLDVEVVKTMSNVCISSTVRIPLLIFIGLVCNHGLQLSMGSSILKSIVHPMETIKGLMGCLATYLTRWPRSSGERRSEICCCLWTWRGVPCWRRIS
jgi:hypothetical protein